MLLKQLLGGAHDAAALEAVHARGGTAISVARSRADFDDEQHVALARYQVQLAETTPVISEEQHRALRLQMGGGNVLGRRANLPAIDRGLELRQHDGGQ